MINIRQDLIKKELERGCTNGLTFQKLKPSNRFINKLFNHYYVVEHTEHFYDLELECGTEFDNSGQKYDIEFNNWIDPYSEGIWGMSQSDVDKISRQHLKNTKKCGVSYNGRLYIAKEDNHVFIYYYGRDFAQLDYWWIFEKKEKTNG